MWKYLTAFFFWVLPVGICFVQLLVALVSAYRYEGPKVKDDTAKSEAKTLAHAIKNADKRNPIEDDEVIRILSTRSKPHLKEIYKHYQEISGHNIDEVCIWDTKRKRNFPTFSPSFLRQLRWQGKKNDFAYSNVILSLRSEKRESNNARETTFLYMFE